MLYSLGHSILSWPEFLRLITQVDLLVDVRSHPTSRWVQFTREHLQEQLQDRYQWWPALGGWTQKHLPLQPAFPTVDIAAYAGGFFPKQHIAKTDQIDPEKPTWTSIGLLDYAYYTSLPEFLNAARQLLVLGQAQNVGFMCSEALYYKCHRSMIADYLLYCHADTNHLTLTTRTTREVTHSTVLGNRLTRYPTAVLQSWDSYNRSSG